MTSITVPLWAWALFAGVVVASLAVDLIQHRGNHASSRRAALVWSGVWIAVSLLFAAWLGVQFGHRAWHDFLTAWLVEKSLSIDNVIAVIAQKTTAVSESSSLLLMMFGALALVAGRRRQIR